MQEKTQIISSESVSQLNGHGKNNQIILDDTFVFSERSMAEQSSI